MSAIRRKERRGTARSVQASPYARPPSKKSSWSITGFLSYLNPLRLRSSVEEVPHSSPEASPEPPSEQASFAANSLSVRGHQIAHDINAFGRPNALAGPSTQQPPLQSPPQQTSPIFSLPTTPARPDLNSILNESSSPAKNLETVSTFLSERAGKPISDIEVEGLISLIQKSTPPDKPEPFRFSSSTPSTPARGNSPFASNPSFALSPTPAPSQIPTSSHRKTLSRNPNGVYRWEGGGSAKPARTRNRYSSPAFGPSRSTSERLVLKDNKTGDESAKSDTKRRRVGEEAVNSSASPSGSTTHLNGSSTIPPLRSPAPDPSPTRSAQALPFPISTPTRSTASSKSNGVSRLRPPALPQKPTLPAIPSPLRQAWSGASPPSNSDSKQVSSQPQQKQTKAANFMAELIKEVTPPKKPDVSNPYQTASPVGKVGTAKPRAKRIRATGKPTVPVQKDEKETEKEKVAVAEKEKEYSQQAIIEATLPKGSKRSRPPAHFEKPLSPEPEDSLSPKATSPPRRSPRNAPRELPSEEKSQQISQDINGKSEVDDDENSRIIKKSKPSLNGLGTVTRNGTHRKVAAPIPEIVIQEDVDMQGPTSNKESEKSPGTSFAPASSTSPISGGTSSSTTTGRSSFGGFKSASAPKEPSKLRFSYQPELNSSPAASPAPSPPITQTSSDIAAKDATKLPEPKDVALSVARDSLPTYVFMVAAVTPLSFPPEHINVRDEVKALPKSSLPSFDFDKPAVGKDSATVNPSEQTAPPPKAFDWAAAGMKAPAGTGNGASWTCSICMLSNPATAIDKCKICDSPR